MLVYPSSNTLQQNPAVVSTEQGLDKDFNRLNIVVLKKKKIDLI